MSRTLKVAVTGAAGQIGYGLLPRLASGDAFGPDTKIILHLLEITPALPVLEGVVMELDDCSLPLLQDVVVTDDPNVAFDGVNWALLVGSRPRGKGMERSDLLRVNGPIFVGQGQALGANAADDIRVLVVGNPANTNCYIASQNAGDIPADRFSAMTLLDQNRATAQLAKKAGVHTTAVSNITIWGNHSSTQYPDTENAKINGKPATEIITDTDWLRGEFISIVQKRGAAVIAARGLSSAASAANAVLDHVRNFDTKTPAGELFSAAIPSDGSYGIDKGLVFSYPLVSDGAGNVSIVQDLPLSDFAKEKVDITHNELRQEQDTVSE